MFTATNFLRDFRAYADACFTAQPHLDAIFEDGKDSVAFKIKKSSEFGFDLGATCETYGIYPWADAWHGAPWEPYSRDQIDELIQNFFGLIRMLVSPEARIRRIMRNNKIRKAIVELHYPDGWMSFEEMGLFHIPLGKRSEDILQNNHLQSRYPYNGLTKTHWGVYLWT